MNRLIVYGDDADIKSGEGLVFSYSLGAGSVLNSEVLNDASLLNRIALIYRDRYSDYVYSLNSIFLENDLIYNNDLSLYFISDLSNKRTEIFDTYISICHLILLKRKIKKYNISSVEFIGCDNRFIESFRSSIKVDLTKKRVKTHYIRKGKWYWYFLSQFRFFLKYFFSLIFFKVFFSNKSHGIVNSLFLTRYPQHFVNNSYEEKYGKLVKKDDCYLISILADGMHQGISFYSIIKSILKLNILFANRKIILLDREVGFYDLFKNFLYSMRLFFNFNKVKSGRKFIFIGINITNYIHEEINQSILRIPRLTLYQNAIYCVFHDNVVANFYYHLHEYSYGKFFSYMLNKHFPKVNKIGFQHGPASMRKVLYFLSKYETGYKKKNYRKFLPMPDSVLAEDNYSKRVYEAANYTNIKVMKEVYRLDYLKYISRDHIKKGTVLIACGLHDSKILLDEMRREISINKDRIYYFKLHHRSNKKNL